MRSSEVTDGEDVADELINLFVPDEKKDDDARGPKGRVATRRFFKAALVALMTFACAFSMYVVVARDRRREGMWGVQQHLRVKVHRGDPSGGHTLEHLFAGAPNVDLTHPSIKLSTAITQVIPPFGPEFNEWRSFIVRREDGVRCMTRAVVIFRLVPSLTLFPHDPAPLWPYAVNAGSA
jgi:hypothetical protein